MEKNLFLEFIFLLLNWGLVEDGFDDILGGLDLFLRIKVLLFFPEPFDDNCFMLD